MNPILTVRGLHKRFGNLHVLKGVDLTVKPGEVTFFIGPSGGGKTTLLRCLNFLETPNGGTILRFGRNYAELVNPGGNTITPVALIHKFIV